MNQKINFLKFFLLCPVPEEQRPINEYIKIKHYFDIKFFQKFDILKVFYSIFLFPNWFFIKKKLSLPYIIYEEASWYDGQVWQKPFFLIKNDRFLINQKLIPIYKKYISFIYVIFLLLSFCFSFKT